MDFRDCFDPAKLAEYHADNTKRLFGFMYSNWQSIFPVNSNNNTTVNNYAGTPSIEETVTREVASYGAQLGWLSDIVLALADNTHYTSKDVEYLKKAVAEIAKIKEAVNDGIKDRAIEALAKLEKKVPDEVQGVLDRFNGKAGKKCFFSKFWPCF